MKRLGLILAGSALLAGPVLGAVSDEEFQQLRSDFNRLAERLERLASENAELRRANQKTTMAVENIEKGAVSQADNWSDRISVKGDFRYRYQNEDVEIAADERNRSRIRARAEINARLSSDLNVGLGLASGSDDPVSTNQTLGNAGSTKSINLDLAYFDWVAYENTNVRGGKFKNPFVTPAKSQLQFDGDWRPEGANVAWDNGTWFAQVLGLYLESDSNLDSEFAYVVQAGARGEIEGIKLEGGIGYTDIDSRGSNCFYDGADPDGCRGNSIAGTGQYLYDFQIIDLFAQATTTVADLPFMLWVDFVSNGDAGPFDTGYQVGVQLGKAKKQGSWQATYYYQDIEADATLGLLTNSDFGAGGTDAKGSAFQAGYALTDRTSVNLSYYLVEKQDSNGLLNGGVPFDVDTVQFDIGFKYD